MLLIKETSVSDLVRSGNAVCLTKKPAMSTSHINFGDEIRTSGHCFHSFHHSYKAYFCFHSFAVRQFKRMSFRTTPESVNAFFPPLVGGEDLSKLRY